MNIATPHYETYVTMALCTSHLAPEDIIKLEALAQSQDCQLVSSRKTGFFIKLYAADKENMEVIIDQFQKQLGLSKAFNRIAAHAIRQNYRLIEFDQDADECNVFKTHRFQPTL